MYRATALTIYIILSQQLHLPFSATSVSLYKARKPGRQATSKHVAMARSEDDDDDYDGDLHVCSSKFVNTSVFQTALKLASRKDSKAPNKAAAPTSLLTSSSSGDSPFVLSRTSSGSPGLGTVGKRHGSFLHRKDLPLSLTSAGKTAHGDIGDDETIAMAAVPVTGPSVTLQGETEHSVTDRSRIEPIQAAVTVASVNGDGSEHCHNTRKLSSYSSSAKTDRTGDNPENNIPSDPGASVRSRKHNSEPNNRAVSSVQRSTPTHDPYSFDDPLSEDISSEGKPSTKGMKN